MENAVFSFNRFGRYFRSDFLNCVRNYGISFLVLSSMALSADIFNGLFSFTLTGAHEWHGTPEPVRLGLFFLFFMVLIITSPAKLYGYVTDRRDGTAFLMLPASRLEKYLSMVLNTCIIVPLLFVIDYLCLDGIVCLIDPTCGVSIIHRITVDLADFRADMIQFINVGGASDPNAMEILNSISPALNPWIFVDDIIGVSIVFLLGALIFKTGKAGKTLGSVVVIALSLELVLSPIIGVTMFSKIHSLYSSGADMTLDMIQSHFPFLSWCIRNLVLFDFINDTIMNGLMLFFVWLRFKNLKH